jgi:guanosine-3',5'-bis(diphosphate) 3'-pyrophosphohydrolase
MEIDIQTAWQQALKFAAAKHAVKNQTVPGTNLPYTVHITNVAMEILVAAQHSENFDAVFAVQVALLHDTLEDTETAYDELAAAFSPAIAEAVAALTKNKSLPKPDRMNDSLQRVRKLQKEVWAVKLADRITNLQPPPKHWDAEKIKAYKLEAREILESLRGGNEYLEARLQLKIGEYERYIPAVQP